jgi:hypothetical protein
MPVTLLLCEGVQGSPDVRVLRALLAGLPTQVDPVGSKYGMDTRIIVTRRISTTATVMGLRDADFDGEWNSPRNVPAIWSKSIDGQPVQLGWRWARKEIENYLIDPTVVSKALGSKAPPPDKYSEILEQAATELSDYTAARVALSLSRITLKQFPNRWGKPRGGDSYPFPDELSSSSCRKNIKRIVRKQIQGSIPEPDEVVTKFRYLRAAHRPGGIRRQHFLHTYAGKDMLIQMNDRLRLLGFNNFGEFRERILLGIRDTTDDIAEWVPEWAALRDQVRDFNS